ncbi:MAG: thioredoxin family protein [Candidatus Heimdallarchaeaceae archaeon]
MTSVFRILYFKSPSCNWCPYVEIILKKLTAEYQRLDLEIIDITEDIEKAEEYNIIALPTIILPNMQRIVGAVDEKFLRDQLRFYTSME